MKKLMVNLVAMMIIGMGGLYLTIPQTANASANMIEAASGCNATFGAKCHCDPDQGCDGGIFHCHCTGGSSKKLKKSGS